MNKDKVYVVTSCPKGAAAIDERRACFMHSVWNDEENAKKERLRLVSEDKE